MATAAAKSGTRAHPLRLSDYFTLNIYWFALSYLWNSIGPIILPTLVANLVPESQKGSALGLISSIGLVVAVVVQPAAGSWTDHHTTRWGRRRPYIVGGTAFDAIFLLALAFSGSYAMLLVAYILLQISSNLAHGPYQGYIPDLIPQAKRGAVSGVARFMEIVAIIVTSLATGKLVGEGQIAAAIISIIVFLLFAMILTAVFVTEEPFEGAESSASQAQARSSHGLSEYVHTLLYSRDFALWLVSRLIILLGGNLVRNYALYFLQDVLRLPDPAAAVGNLLAIIAVAIALVVYPAGALSDRVGRKGLIIVSGVLGAIGSLLMVTASDLTQVLIYGGIIGISIGIFLSVNWAWATDLIPAEGAGLYLGISNLATAGSGVLAAGGGFLLDYFNAQQHNLGYTVLFFSAAICYLSGTVIAGIVKDTRMRREATALGR